MWRFVLMRWMELEYKASLNGSFMGTIIQTDNQITVPHEFNGDETFLTSHETPSLFVLAMSSKLMTFNAMEPSMKLLLKLDSFRACHQNCI